MLDFSRYKVKINYSNTPEFLARAKEKNIFFHSMTDDNHYIYAIMQKKDIKKLNILSEQLNFSYEKRKKNNLFTDYFTFKKTICFLLFFIISAGFLTLFSFRISIISVDSGDTLVDKKILSILEEKNIKKGSFTFNINIKEAENSIKSKISSLAWISILKNGSQIKILTRLATEKVQMLDETLPCNIIAGEDLKIRNVIVNSGKLVALPGTVLRKGDVIISGIYKNINGGQILRHAKGVITAEFEKSVVFIQKKSETVKENSENRFSNLYLDLFSVSIPLFDYDNPYQDYTLKKTSYFSSVLQRKIPVFIRKETYIEKNIIQKIYTQDYIEKILENEISNYENSCLKDFEIINKDIETTEKDNLIIMNINYTLVGDVGIEQEIVVW
jgi:sporulation protein YqfD